MQSQFLAVFRAVDTRSLSSRSIGAFWGVAALLGGHSIAVAQPAQPVQLEGEPLSADENLPSNLPDSLPSSLPSGLPGQTAPSREENYLLGVGDYLRVDVFNIPDYGGEFRVLSGGVVNLPVVGLVAVEGLSLRQAATQIEQSLAPFVRRPRVTLSVLEARPLQVAIAGEVSRPGTYQLGADNANEASEASTLTQVIELAGGITQLADIRQIAVHRRLPPGPAALQSGSPALGSGGESADSQVISVNLWNLLKEGDLNEDIRLQNGDRIVIPTATALSPDEATELGSASFAPDEISVNVVGEVETPGAITVPPNTPLNQVLLTAGGFNNRARRASVNLIRLNPNGTVSQREIEVDFSEGIDEAANPPLRPNDTVVVQRSGIARVGDAVGTILRPIRESFGVLRLFGL
ncbi:MAG: SLBB domain-containing protein [Cyanobacteria bacterium P01_A01_bin.114]